MLAPDEEVHWQGRPSGRPRLRTVGVAYLVLVAFLFAFGPWLARGKAARFVRPTVALFDRDASGAVVLAPRVVRSSPAAAVGWAAILVATGALEVVRTLLWRRRRYWITVRRLVATDWQGRVLAQVPRVDVARVTVENRDLVVEGAGRVVRFEGLDDLAAARAALEAR